MSEEIKYRRLKIISDGSKNCNGTRVVDAETGEIFPNVSHVSFVHKAGDIPKAWIELTFPEIELTTEAETVKGDRATMLVTRPEE